MTIKSTIDENTDTYSEPVVNTKRKKHSTFLLNMPKSDVQYNIDYLLNSAKNGKTTFSFKELGTNVLNGIRDFNNLFDEDVYAHLKYLSPIALGLNERNIGEGVCETTYIFKKFLINDVDLYLDIEVNKDWLSRFKKGEPIHFKV